VGGGSQLLPHPQKPPKLWTFASRQILIVHASVRYCTAQYEFLAKPLTPPAPLPRTVRTDAVAISAVLSLTASEALPDRQDIESQSSSSNRAETSDSRQLIQQAPCCMLPCLPLSDLCYSRTAACPATHGAVTLATKART